MMQKQGMPCLHDAGNPDAAPRLHLVVSLHGHRDFSFFITSLWCGTGLPLVALWFYFRATLTSPARLASASPESLWQRIGETLTAKIHGTLPEKVVGFLHRER
ncbi:MAG: hypothetical protein M0O96_06880 [Desulforhopalus sp.]|nr:hypothetical protein [Desulforhopalus sp.]